MRRFKIEEAKEKDHYILTISGVNLGRFERSELRYLIEAIDNTINIGL